MSKYHIHAYWEFCQEVRMKWPQCLTWFDLMRLWLPWAKTIENFKPNSVGLPILPMQTMHTLSQSLQPGMKVWEWGAGGSTLFFARQGCQVTSIEHNQLWVELVRDALHEEQLEDIVALRHIEAEEVVAAACCHSAFASGDTSSANMTFEAYAKAIEDTPNHSLDLILVDGRSRPACLSRSFDKISQTGAILLDDSNRERYAEAINNAPASFTVREYIGPRPYSAGVSSFTAFYPDITKATIKL